PAVGAAVDDVGVPGVGDDVAALAARRHLPVLRAGARAVRDVGDAQGRVVLLRAQEPVGEGVVGRDAVELCRRLVPLGRPGGAAVGRHTGAAVVRLDHPQRVVGGDPEVVVVAVRGADRRPALAAVLRLVELDVDDVDRVLVLGIGVDAAVVPGALAQVAALAHLLPGIAAVVRAEDPAVLGLGDGVEVLRVGGGDGDADDPQGPLGHAGLPRQLVPGVAAVGRLPEGGARAAAVEAPGGAPEAPGRGVDDPRVDRVEDQVDGAGVLADEEDAVPALAAVLRAVDAAGVVGTEGVTQDGHVDE